MSVEYRTLLDDEARVEPGSGVTYDFKLPTTAVLGDRARKPIFSFMFSRAALYPLPGYIFEPDKWFVGLAVEVNARRIGFYRFGAREASVERVIWEVDRDHLRAGQDNTLHFEIDSGGGVVSISDVVLWYHTR